MNKLDIAKAAHDVNRGYCMSIGDTSQPEWADAPQWQKDSAVNGVTMHLANPDATPQDSHNSWLAEKEAAGWKFGPEKNPEKKEHPCMLPYDQLPAAQRTKDYLFKAVVHTLAPHLAEDKPAQTTTEERLSVTGNAANAPGEKILLPAPVGGLGGIPVTYIGKRAEYREGIYRSGLLFKQGETKMVPAALAAQLLRHADQYKLGEVKKLNVSEEEAQSQALDITAATVKAAAKDHESDEKTHELEDTRRAIGTMNRQTMANFAKANFNQTLDPVALTVAEMRSKLGIWLDQFGLPGSKTSE